MTILQKEIAERSTTINGMGHLMMSGLVDITPDSESIMQTAMTIMLALNEHDRKMVEEITNK